jgi:hypothetical protein
MEDDAQEFIKELEERHQGTITWRTYATWYGNDSNIIREFGVFLYRCKDSFYYEDFERSPSMFGFTLKTNKKKEPFHKFEGSFKVSDILELKQVTKQQAIKVAQGFIQPDTLNKANSFDRIFRQLVEMVTLKDGSVHFFELIDRKSFAEELHN